MKISTLSMTGFGSASSSSAEAAIEVEIRSVNHKFLDISLKMPRSYGPIEAEIRSTISKALDRGRVEVTITRKVLSAKALPISFNQALFDRYLTASTDVLTAYGGMAEESVPSLLFHLVTNRELLSIDDQAADLKKESKLVLKALSQALVSFIKMRAQEGKALAKDIQGRGKQLTSLLKKAQARAASTPKEKASKLKARISALDKTVVLDPHRFAQEVALIADRIDVTEELTRVKSHLDQLTKSLSVTPQGRKLDFVVQELFREWNTIGSKAQDATLQSFVVEAKLELERLREQIQNVE